MNNYIKLEQIFLEYYKISNIKTLMEWDKHVNLPSKSYLSFINQIKYLDKIQNSLLQNKKINKYFQSLSKDPSLENTRNITLMQKLVEEAVLYPKKLQDDLLKMQVECEFAWREAKKEGNFLLVQKQLKSLFYLIKEKANIRGNWLNKPAYEAMIDIYDPGQVLNSVRSNLMSTKHELISMVRGAKIGYLNGMNKIDKGCKISLE